MNSDELSLALQREFPDLDSALVAAIALDATDLEEARKQCSYLYFETIVDRDYEDQFSQSSTHQGAVSVDGSVFSVDGSKCSSGSDGSWDTDRENQQALLDLERKPIDSKVSFLSMCFPMREQEELKLILAGCDNNISRALDDLLSLHFINQQGSGPEIDGLAPDRSHISRSKKKRNRRNIQNIENVWDSGHSPWKSSPLPANHIDSSELIRFTGLLDIPIERARAMEQRHSGSRTALYLQLLEANPGLIWSTGGPNMKENLKELSTTFPGLPSLICWKILRATKNDLDKSTQIALMILLKSQEIGEDLTTFIADACDGNVSQSVSVTHDKFVTVPKRKGKTIAREQQLSAAELHQVMEEKLMAHSELLKKTKELDRRRNNKNLHSSASAHYRVAANELANDVKYYRLEYARALVAETGTQYCIDFHGVGIHEANIICREKLDEWWENTNIQKPRPPLKIITGAGNHSAKGKARILPFLIQSLGGEGWMFYVGHGYIVVYGFRGQR
ncbi:hypothetical protein V1520DRAFT_355359 [Lipomyces starkeyi]|uniref:Smr domain-containing protein n=1 Tax=Lipomyces starkeyi NRRL Y-11557 TaxID=675824 RepID=A0A1E3Q2C7_LIPST|nr:hypothetical protein LIPSTDRAFT_4881 [Lipomyces starkeyi NRRL Y-11557]